MERPRENGHSPCGAKMLRSLMSFRATYDCNDVIAVADGIFQTAAGVVIREGRQSRRPLIRPPEPPDAVRSACAW